MQNVGRSSSRGFTIVELLIVIVIIGILAALVIVAYNGLQGRARDSQRQSDIASIEKALELYKADNGGYPKCGAGTYVAGDTRESGTVASCLTTKLVPAYASKLPNDPTNTGSFVYRYAVGYKKTGATSYDSAMSSNYIIGTKLDSITSPVYSGWGYNDLTFLDGSAN